jgi:PAS domain S-box-containing protein
MYYNTTLGFTLCGAGLLATAREWTLLARAASSAVIVLGVVTLSQYLVGVNLGIDQLLMRDFILLAGVAPGRMASTTAFSFVCGGVALLIMNRQGRAAIAPARRVLVSILGTIPLAVGSLTVCMHVLNLVAAYGWGTEMRAMAMHTGAGFLLLGGVLLLQTWRTQDSSRHAPNWLPIASAAAGTVLTLIGWQVLLIQAQRDLEHVVHLTAVQVTNELRARMDGRILALQRMVEHWEYKAPLTRAEWEREAELNLRDFPGFQAISWTDPSLHIRWLVPLAGNERALGLHIGEANPRRATIERAREQRKTVISPPYTLAQGDKGLIASVPIFANGQFGGIISGVFRIEPLFDTILHNIAPGYGIALFTAAEEFYRRTPQGSVPGRQWGSETTLSLHGITWHVLVWPSTAILAQERSVMPTAVLTFGLFISGLLAYMVFLAQIGRERARDVAAANRRLDTLNAQLEQRVQERTAELRESEERFRRAFDDARVPMALFKPDGQYLRVNPATCEFFGYTEPEMLSLAVTTLTHPDDVAQSKAMIQQVLSSDREAYHFEKRFRHKSGATLWAVANGTLIRDAEGTPLYFVTMMQDTTARKQAEDTLAQHSLALARANSDLRQLAYISAHDLQEPVRQLSVYARALASEYHQHLTGEGNLFLSYVIDGAIYISALLSDLLTYLELDRSNIERTATDCEVLFDQVSAEIGQKMSASEYSLTHDALPILAVSTSHLRLVFTQLLENALKFRGADPPRVHVWAEREGHAWRFAVRDNGIGMAPEYTEQIFAICKRLHPRSQYPGTGMGLAICKKIIEQHGGRIWVESELGQGATFFFTIADPEPPPYSVHDTVAERLRLANEELERRVEERTAALTLVNTALQQEIAARQGAEQAGRVSEARYRALVNAIPEMVWEAGPDGAMMIVSDRWLQYCGLTAEQMARDWPQLVVHPDDYDRCVRQWTQALAEGTNYEIEVRNRRYDGEYRWFLTRAVPARDTAGHIIGWYGTTVDIHDRKQAEEEQARLLAEIRRANTEHQQFAYIVSHDLNEPLRTITSFLHLLTKRLQGKLDTEATEYFAFVRDGAERLQLLLKDLLAYTSVDGSAQTFTVVDSANLLTQVLDDLHATIADNMASITHDALPTVTGDAAQLRLVLQNLIGNALKFRAAPPPQIHISAQRNGTHWQFSVRDNGIGLDPHQTVQIFQVFRRLHPSQEYAGTGIGLAICKRIVERHGGRIWVDSTPGNGATFYFTIPV